MKSVGIYGINLNDPSDPLAADLGMRFAPDDSGVLKAFVHDPNEQAYADSLLSGTIKMSGSTDPQSVFDWCLGQGNQQCVLGMGRAFGDPEQVGDYVTPATKQIKEAFAAQGI